MAKRMSRLVGFRRSRGRDEDVCAIDLFLSWTKGMAVQDFCSLLRRGPAEKLYIVDLDAATAR